MGDSESIKNVKEVAESEYKGEWYNRIKHGYTLMRKQIFIFII